MLRFFIKYLKLYLMYNIPSPSPLPPLNSGFSFVLLLLSLLLTMYKKLVASVVNVLFHGSLNVVRMHCLLIPRSPPLSHHPRGDKPTECWEILEPAVHTGSVQQMVKHAHQLWVQLVEADGQLAAAVSPLEHETNDQMNVIIFWYYFLTFWRICLPRSLLSASAYRHLLSSYFRYRPHDVFPGTKRVERVTAEAVTGIMGSHPYSLETPSDFLVFVTTVCQASVL